VPAQAEGRQADRDGGEAGAGAGHHTRR
jgi:hypothetical protein